MLQNVFQSFFVTAERPELGLKITIAAGLVNMFLDFLLTAVIKGGVIGAGLATAISQLIGGVIPLIYFIMPNKSRLHLGRTKFSGKVVFITCTNGSSELMTNVSMSVVNMLYNYQLMKLVGENGVSAYGVIMYVSFIFIGVFLGYSIGSIPVIGYHYGAQNTKELKSLLKKKSCHSRSIFGGAYDTCGSVCGCACGNIRQLRRGSFCTYKTRIYAVFNILHDNGLQYFRFVIFHCTQQRLCVCNYLVCKNAGLSDIFGNAAADSAWHRRYMAVYRACGEYGCYTYNKLLCAEQKKI